jgi:hypothetical protein
MKNVVVLKTLNSGPAQFQLVLQKIIGCRTYVLHIEFFFQKVCKGPILSLHFYRSCVCGCCHFFWAGMYIAP